MAQYIADWNPLGRDFFYRKFELYSMGWHEQVDLNECVLAGAMFGGPIAITRDDKKIIKLPVGVGKAPILIFSSSGHIMSSLKKPEGKVLHMGWSNCEDFILIMDDGVVQLYNIFGTLQKTFSIGQEAKDAKLLDCKIFCGNNGTGVVAITTKYKIFMIKNIKDPRTQGLAEIPGLDSPPSAWAVLCEEQTAQVLLAKDNEFYVLDQINKAHRKYPEFSFPSEAITEISVSFNNKHVALFTAEGMLWIGSSDLQRRYCEHKTKFTTRPKQLVWCGSSAVVCSWESLLLVVGLNNTSINYSMEFPMVLIPELDGVRIISNFNQEFLQRVPAVVAEIFKIGSMAPGAILLEALKEFQKKSLRADDYIRSVKDQLEEAVTQCIQSAGHEFNSTTQKLLLRAASFGKGFIPDFSPDSFVQMCHMLRVLNAVRDYTVGLPITYAQLDYLTIPVLLDRLVLRRHYCLAIKISNYLKIPDVEGASRILANWACYKVKQTHLDGDVVAKEIAAKLGYTPGISYSEIANKATECGRNQLAIKLLDYETKASEQVPLLMKLNQDLQAMSKAIDSGDTDLIYTVILHLHNILTSGDFHMTIRRFPVAYTLYLKYCKAQNLEMVRALYYQEDNHEAVGNCKIIESYKADRWSVRQKLLGDAHKDFQMAKSEFSATQTEEQIRLLGYQDGLRKKFEYECVSKSLHETMYILLMDRQIKLAEELKKEFKVPEKRFWWLRVQTLAELGDWVELDKLSKSKKSPIGYEPFVDVCLKRRNKYEAQKYLLKVQDSNKVRYYVKAGMLEEAANIAQEQKDQQALLYVQLKCGSNKILADKIQVMMKQIRFK